MSRVSYIEITLPRCSLVYGVAPCAAAIGVTGDHKCYNTRKTCQDLDNYDETHETLRLSKATLSLAPDLNSIPNIISVDHTPSELNLGESMGVRATLTVEASDFPFPDTGPAGDKYYAERDYQPDQQGTFWGKFVARYPYMRGQDLCWYTGDAEDTLDTMDKRCYVIDRIVGPNTDGRVTIVAKDPLILLDNRRSQAPRLNSGILAAPITDVSGTLTLNPLGIGDAQYPASGYVNIGGSEIASFTRVDDTLTLTARGLYNTEAVEHEEEDRVQVCLVYSAVEISEILYDLMTTYGNIPAGYIDFDSWQNETTSFLDLLYSGVVPDPKPVKELVNEILEQAAISMWWSELSARIQIQVLRNIPMASLPYTDDFMLAGSFNQEDQPEKRVSQVWFYYGKINPLEGEDDPSNYRTTLATVSLESEDNYGEAAIKKIFSRWIIQFGRAQAERVSSLILSRFSDPPKKYKFTLLQNPIIQRPTLGAGYFLESFLNQAPSGEIQRSRTQITSVRADDSTWHVTAEEVRISDIIIPVEPTTKFIPIDNDIQDVNMRDIYTQLYPEATEGDTIICQIRSGVVVRGSSITRYAFRTGTGWPAGVTLRLEVFPGAYIVGRGGKGGDAVGVYKSFAIRDVRTQPGQPGGNAILVEHPIEIDNNGIIGAGGGAGGGAASTSASGFIVLRAVAAASGGGGGAGFGAIGVATSNSWGTARDGRAGTVDTGGAGITADNTDSGWFNTERVTVRGGAGGNLGQPGGNGQIIRGGVDSVSPGGSAGVALVGVGDVTWINQGDVRGSIT